MVGLQIALFDVSQRQGVSQAPSDGAENKDGFGLPPFEDRWSGCPFESLQATSSPTPGNLQQSQELGQAFNGTPGTI